MHTYKIRYRSVVCPFEFLVKKASGQFSIHPVIMQAFTTSIFPLTWFVCAVAILLKFFLYTFHSKLLYGADFLLPDTEIVKYLVQYIFCCDSPDDLTESVQGVPEFECEYLDGLIFYQSGNGPVE